MAESSLRAEMQRKLRAGREYHEALCKLGFHPDAVLWATAGGQPDDQPRMELLLVTSWADIIGPKAVYDLLFEAYEASATPQEIDPFIVSLFSPETQVSRDIAGGMRTLRSPEFANNPDSRPMFVLGLFDYSTIPDWVIHYAPRKSTRFEAARRFGAFERNVHRLVA